MDMCFGDIGDPPHEGHCLSGDLKSQRAVRGLAVAPVQPCWQPDLAVLRFAFLPPSPGVRLRASSTANRKTLQ